MKKLKPFKLEAISGGGYLSNRTCSRLGIVAAVAALGQQWSAALGITGAAAVGGCLDAW